MPSPESGNGDQTWGETGSARSSHRFQPSTRREWLLQAGGGFGGLALIDLLSSDLAAELHPGKSSLPAEAPWRLPATARSVIFLFMEGGPSHIDTFDPKPELNRLAGKPLPPSFKPVITPMGEGRAPLLASRRKWKQHGQSGIWVSDWLPHIATCADDLAVIQSCWSNGLNHVGGVCQMNTGSTLAGRPSLGSWVTYGLGSENANLPGFVVMKDTPRATVAGGPRNWGAGFMPAAFQGTQLDGGAQPIANLQTPVRVGPARQQGKLDYLGELNRRHLFTRIDQSELDARIKSYELAFRMQAEAPEAADLARETNATHALYGVGDPATDRIGQLCLLSRRRGAVRPDLLRCGKQVGCAFRHRSEPRSNLSRDGPAGRGTSE
jgi:Protein of unknown function (DUF1501)